MDPTTGAFVVVHAVTVMDRAATVVEIWTAVYAEPWLHVAVVVEAVVTEALRRRRPSALYTWNRSSSREAPHRTAGTTKHQDNRPNEPEGNELATSALRGEVAVPYQVT
ncbi:hypothetical protein F441_04785 [Phytophthora nicotianae CJ01A1]|uniref:Uncharacterized protein n=5 Tax=Phytophthora nicotianae TaxID=4792 RepID=W2QHX3_PHYN3|nr:hypothetical protein PPTG_09050 [Phytophthora nicotianae INRA-310]ETI51983.1 hypothetical protein F443_04782 [Phytophthora nicotianae P1569]ETO80729.1 hypothetical protein F444_04834 [Phytophthora nicotianae P1976]ETP21768.1 hypothetical protein F441_04785 [Phytophthora nicotianae CJ01A1]ETP49659.1 hypothetical protein F442_04862 [Phytophthora nicotianae P10297]ETN12144.1 hypothetical protein PPTG_09050 [Phytophthora nicotianae INRA-310]